MSIYKNGITKNSCIKEKDKASMTHIKTQNEGTNYNLNSTIGDEINFEYKGQTIYDDTMENQLIDFAVPYSMSIGSNGSYSFTNDVVTATSDGTSNYSSIMFNLLDIYKNNPGRTLRFQCDSFTSSSGLDGTLIQFDLRFNDGTANQYKVLMSRTGVISNLVIPNDTSNVTYAQFRIGINNTNTATAGTITLTKPMLYFGTTNIEYQRYRLYNLFDISSGMNNSGYPADIEGNKFYFRGTLAGATRILHFKCKLKAGHHYLVRGTYRNLGGTSGLYDVSQLGFYEGVREIYYGSPLNKNAYLTPQNDLDYIYIYIPNKYENVPDLNVEVSDLRIYEASSTTDERKFEPYVLNKPNFINLKTVGGNQTIKSSTHNYIKNSQSFSFDYDNGGSGEGALNNETYNDCAVRYLDTTSLSTSNYKTFVQYSNVRYNLDLDFKAGDYFTFSFWAKGETSNLIEVFFYGNTGYAGTKAVISNGSPTSSGYGDGNVRFQNVITSEWQRFYVTYQIDPNANNDKILIDKHLLIRQWGGNKLYVCGCMIERGQTTGSDYIENYYQSNTLHFSKYLDLLDNEKIYNKQCNWYKHNEWIKTMIHENSPISLLSDATVSDTYLFEFSRNLRLENYSTNYLCSHFKTNNAAWDTVIIGSYVYNKTLRMRVPSSIATTVEEFKTWLAYNNITLYYKLETSNEVKITDSVLLTDLNNRLLSYNNRTVLISNGDLPIILSAKTNSIYKKLEYLKGEGSQYINTGIIATSNVKLVLDYENGSTGGKWIIGGRTAYQSADSIGIHINFNNTYTIVNSASRDITNDINIRDINSRHILELSGTAFVVDDVTIATYTNSITNGTYPIYIFSCNSGNAADSRMSNGKLYSCKIYDENNLIGDFIPVMRITDNVVGLYNILNDTFYTNQGTGAFTEKELGIASKIDSNNILYVNDFYEI